MKSHRKPKNHTEHKSTQKHTKAFWQIHKTFNAKDSEFFCHDLLFFLSKVGKKNFCCGARNVETSINEVEKLET